ncbi:MAG: ATP-binding protein [Candidatus Saganbacteria bacterium]|nr:ATP-binding protein [Candidatus Saganbacteria bacterium]
MPTTDLDRLIKLAPYLVCKSMKLTGASVMLFDRTENIFRVRFAIKGASRLLNYSVKADHEIFQELSRTQKPLVKDEIGDRKIISEELKRWGASLSIPSISISEYFGKPTVLSVLNLGEKMSGEAFSAEDIAFLETLANQASITIEHAFILEDLRKNEEKLIQTEKLAALGTMAAGVAHEIKNPLAALKLFAEIMPLKFDDPSYRAKFTSIIPTEVSRLRGIVEDLSSFSKPKEAKMEMIPIENVLEKTLKFLSIQFKTNNIRVKTDYAKTPKVLVDSNKMMQVFMNIMNNAVHAMEKGGELGITTGLAGEKISIRISDTGIGIPHDKLREIFDPFFTTKEFGTGLGLAITHKIIDDHRGSIDVESEIGKGTCFTIYLPVTT